MWDILLGCERDVGCFVGLGREMWAGDERCGMTLLSGGLLFRIIKYCLFWNVATHGEGAGGVGLL